jgi:hypothetical protein
VAISLNTKIFRSRVQLQESTLPGKEGTAHPVHTMRTHTRGRGGGVMVQIHSLLTGFNFRPRLLDLLEGATVHTEREAGWALTAGLYVLERVSYPKRDSNSAPSSS